MSTVRLRLESRHTAKIGKHYIRQERIFVWLRILRKQPPHFLREAVLDTGAHISVFPQLHWQLFEEEITWLSDASDPSLPDWCRRFSGVAGGMIECRIGTVEVEFFDHLGGRLGPSPLVGMFAFDNGQMPKVLIGLGGGVFAGRRLEMVYDASKIVLSEL
jgi:hypothetical protein